MYYFISQFMSNFGSSQTKDMIVDKEDKTVQF